MNKHSPHSFSVFLFHLSPLFHTSFFLPSFPLALEPLLPEIKFAAQASNCRPQSTFSCNGYVCPV